MCSSTFEPVANSANFECLAKSLDIIYNTLSQMYEDQKQGCTCAHMKSCLIIKPPYSE